VLLADVMGAVQSETGMITGVEAEPQDVEKRRRRSVLYAHASTLVPRIWFAAVVVPHSYHQVVDRVIPTSSFLQLP
jgi:hypothetical protein